MREFDHRSSNNNINKNNIEVVEKEKQEYKLIDRIVRTRGLRLYSYNLTTDEINEIVLSNDVNNTIYTTIRDNKLCIDYEKTFDKAVIDPRNKHFEALNMNNAIRRVEKWKNGKIKELDNLRYYTEDKIDLY